MFVTDPMVGPVRSGGKSQLGSHPIGSTASGRMRPFASLGAAFRGGTPPSKPGASPTLETLSSIGLLVPTNPIAK